MFALGALLLAALSSLLLLGMAPQLSKGHQALTALTDLEIADSDLHQNVLDARAGLLRNYDPINAAVARLYDSVRRMREVGVTDVVLAPLNELVVREDDLSEHFKTDNALLRNSLAYFGRFSNQVGQVGSSDTIGPAVITLVAAILRLTLDTSVPAVTAVDNRLRRLAQLPVSGDEANLVAELLSHGQLLRRMLPETDQILRSFYEAPSAAYVRAARASILAQQQKAEATAAVYRFLLYATSVALAALLIGFALQLRRYVTALRRRIEFEHILAATSVRFIAAQASNLDEQVGGALALLAAWVGASRSYLVAPGTPPQSFLWSQTEAHPANEWCSAVAAVAREADVARTGAVFLSDTRKSRAGAAYASLVQAPVAGWVCVSDGQFVPGSMLLGFDTSLARLHIADGELRLLSIALDTLAKAIEHERFERERRALESRLQQAHRLQAIGTLSSGIAHNFNNIVGAILGYTEMELEGNGDSVNLRGIQSAAERARELVDQLMDFGQRRERRITESRLVDLITETASVLEALLPPQTRLSVGLVPETAIVAADPGEVQQIILNLCNNAAQAALDGDVATIAVTVEVLHNPRVRQVSHGLLAAGRYACLSVRDCGLGMDAKTLERLFEPFFTTRQNGNGLGLATVQAIVRAYGGAVDVASRVGAGSRFDIWLPLINPAAGAAASEPGFGMRGKGEVVLLVDADAAGLSQVEELVAALGYEPLGFNDFDRALQAFRRAPENFDVALIAMSHPAADVVALCTAIRNAARTIPIVLVAQLDELHASALGRLRAAEIIAKPLRSADLAFALRRCFSTRPAPMSARGDGVR